MELLDAVGVREEVVQFSKFLAVVEVFQQIIVDFEAFHHVLGLETERVDLSDLVVRDIEVFELFEVLETVDFVDFVAGGFEHLELVEFAVLESVEIFEVVVGDVEDGEGLAAVETFELVDVGVVEERLDFVVLEDEDGEGGEVPEHFDGGEFVLGEVEFGEDREEALVEHVVEVFEAGVAQVQDLDGFGCETFFEFLAEDFFRESPSEVFLGLLLLEPFDGDPVENLEFPEDVQGIDAVAAVFGDGVS